MPCIHCGGDIPSTKRKDAKYCSDRCGNRVRNKKFVDKKTPEEKSEYYRKRNAQFRSTPYGKYTQHKHSAIQRGIPFELSFEEWMELWEDHWDERGVTGMVMSRINDEGAYKVGNVVIISHTQNRMDAAYYRTIKEANHG